MKQYIDKDALVAEIKGYISNYKEIVAKINRNDSTWVDSVSMIDAKIEVLQHLLFFLNTIEVKDTDLDFEQELYKAFGQVKDFTLGMRIARHFYELGLNSQTKDMQDALRMEYEKGRADVLRCIDPDEMVADFYSQPLSKTRSLASIYRQGILDILKRINNNEETSITGTRSIDDCGL